MTPEGEDFTEPDDSRYNNLMLTGQNSYQSILTKLSTRGDIPGDVSEDEPTTSTTPIPTTTTPPLPDDMEKLFTKIVTTIRLVSFGLQFRRYATVCMYGQMDIQYISISTM